MGPLFLFAFQLGRLTCLWTHLLHHLTHCRYLPRSSLLTPALEPIRGLFQMGQEQRIRPPFPPLGNSRLHALPNGEEFAAGLEEEIFVEQTVVEIGARLVPI